MKVKAAPGIAIVEPLETKQTAAIVTSNKARGRIIPGKIISMGEDDITNSGAIIPAKKYGKTGDIIHFLHYYDEGGVDEGEINGKKYFWVKWGDFRGKE